MDENNYNNIDQFSSTNSKSKQVKKWVRNVKLLILSLVITNIATLIILLTLATKGSCISLGTIEPTKDLIIKNMEYDLIDYETDQLQKRFWWWALGAIVGLANQAFAFYGLATSCKDFSSSKGNAASCIWGAISTAIMIGGIGWKTWQTVDAINTHLTNNGISINPFSKRDEFEQQNVKIIGLLNDFSQSTIENNDISIMGWTWMVNSSSYYGNSTNKKRDGFTQIPLVVISVQGYGNETYKFTGLKLDNGDRKGYLSNNHNFINEKREDFNEENFLNGGIEFYDQYVADKDGDGGKLDQNNDWNRMYSQVSCYLGDLSNNNYIEYQIFDNNNKGTIAEGSVEPFKDQPHDFGGTNSNWDKKNPLPQNGCASG